MLKYTPITVDMNATDEDLASYEDNLSGPIGAQNIIAKHIASTKKFFAHRRKLLLSQSSLDRVPLESTKVPTPEGSIVIVNTRRVLGITFLPADAEVHATNIGISRKSGDFRKSMWDPECVGYPHLLNLQRSIKKLLPEGLPEVLTMHAAVVEVQVRVLYSPKTKESTVLAYRYSLVTTGYVSNVLTGSPGSIRALVDEVTATLVRKHNVDSIAVELPQDLPLGETYVHCDKYRRIMVSETPEAMRKQAISHLNNFNIIVGALSSIRVTRPTAELPVRNSAWGHPDLRDTLNVSVFNARDSWQASLTPHWDPYPSSGPAALSGEYQRYKMRPGSQVSPQLKESKLHDWALLATGVAIACGRQEAIAALRIGNSERELHWLSARRTITAATTHRKNHVDQIK